MEESSQQSLYTLAIFVHEGSSLPATVWRCCDENPAWLTPLKDLVTFMPVKQRWLKAAKSMGSGPFSSLSLFFPLQKSFFFSVLLEIIEHRDHRSLARKGLGKIIWSTLSWKREPRWDCIAPGPTTSYNFPAMGSLLCPWGDCSIGVQMACHDAGLEIMEVLASLGSGVQKNSS